MSLKSVIQIIILLIIFIILGGVYFKYFSQENIIVDESTQETVEEDKNSKKKTTTNQKDKIIENEEIKENINLKNEKSTLLSSDNKKVTKNSETKKQPKIDNKNKDNEIPNLVKDVEYLTTDKNGNKYKILANSGRTNVNDTNILDLDNVRGEITSDHRSTIYIISDFAEYNSSTLGSKFYSNVVINYENKQINCENFDINMDTNFAIAYNDVLVTDPQSSMRAGKITLDIETKEIIINPDESKQNKVKINTKQ